MNNYCTIYLVRHAESLANLNGIVGGDYGLSEKGRKQALELGKKLKNVDFSAVFSSYLLRAEETAKLVIEGRNLEIQKVKNLRERNFGSIENLSNKEYMHLFDALKTMSDKEAWEWKIVDDMETSQEAIGRFQKALFKIAKAYLGKKVLVVSHGNVIRSFLVKTGFATFSQLHGNAIANASYVVIKSDGKNFTVWKTNGIDKSLT